jgi:diguanylate cyclase (GGDEF)-like protein/PAS domain S-box-containing protein
MPDAVTLSTAVRDHQGLAVDMQLGYMNAVARAGHENAKAVIGGLCSELWPAMVENGSFQQCMEVLNTGRAASGAFEWVDPDTGRPAGYDYRAVRVGENILLWVLHDTTEALRAAWSLSESEERYRSVLAVLDEGIILQDAEGTVVAGNAAAEGMLGASVAGMNSLNGSLLGVVDEDGRAIPPEDLPAAVVMDSGEAQIGRVLGVPVGGGELRWFSVNVYPLIRSGEPKPYAVVSSLNDVTERKALEAELKYLALHDALTELPNRTLLFDRLNQSMRRARREKDAVGRLAVIVADLKDFKSINNQFGHEAGDHVLKEVAMRLLTAVREEDTVARLAGDEFVVLLEDVEPTDLPLFAKKIEEVLRRPVVYEGPGARLVDIPIEGRVGEALAKSRDSAKDVLKRADRAIREAENS